MPRRYRRSYKRRRTARRPYYRRRRRFTARPTKRWVKRTIDRNIERKYTVNSVLDAVNTTPICTSLLAGIAQGLESTSDRVGDRIKLKSIRIRGTLFLDAAATINEDFVRMVVVQWRGKGFSSTVADYIHQAFIGDSFSTLQPYNHTRRMEFRILYDKTFTLIKGTNKQAYVFNIVLNRKFRRQIEFAPTATDTLMNSSNGIFFGIVGDTIATDTSVNFVYKVNYKDA